MYDSKHVAMVGTYSCLMFVMPRKGESDPFSWLNASYIDAVNDRAWYLSCSFCSVTSRTVDKVLRPESHNWGTCYPLTLSRICKDTLYIHVNGAHIKTYTYHKYFWTVWFGWEIGTEHYNCRKPMDKTVIEWQQSAHHLGNGGRKKTPPWTQSFQLWTERSRFLFLCLTRFHTPISMASDVHPLVVAAPLLTYNESKSNETMHLAM